MRRLSRLRLFGGGVGDVTGDDGDEHKCRKASNELIVAVIVEDVREHDPSEKCDDGDGVALATGGYDV